MDKKEDNFLTSDEMIGALYTGLINGENFGNILRTYKFDNPLNVFNEFKLTFIDNGSYFLSLIENLNIDETLRLYSILKNEVNNINKYMLCIFRRLIKLDYNDFKSIIKDKRELFIVVSSYKYVKNKRLTSSQILQLVDLLKKGDIFECGLTEQKFKILSISEKNIKVTALNINTNEIITISFKKSRFMWENKENGNIYCLFKFKENI